MSMLKKLTILMSEKVDECYRMSNSPYSDVKQ